MKILNKLTLSNLKLNKKRTMVTIIGIMLSTALITVVIGMVTSGTEALKGYAMKTSGDYHVEFTNVPIEESGYIKENRNVGSIFKTKDLGYSKLENSKNEAKPYLNILAYDNIALEKLQINIRDGRLPQNSHEIVLSRTMQTNGQMDIKVGDKFTLDIGKRYLEGEVLNQNNPYTEKEETIEKEFSREYTVVGIMERQILDIEPYSAPGYTAITYLDENGLDGNLNIFVKYTNKGLKNYKEVTANILEINSNDLIKVTDEDYNEKIEEAKYGAKENTTLLRYSGIGLNSVYVRMMYVIAAIVIGIIVVSSIFVIRNSFAISITERIKQYGMLSSIGATKKQIRKNVLFEGVILALIGIPLGMLLGIVANLILILVLNMLIKNIMAEVQFSYNISIISLVIGIIISSITIYFSCLSSARKAAKVTPIDAIRSSKDIKIKSKKVKSPKLIKKVFGIGGDIAYKNLKRNKKKYRTTVVSLVVSIAIFIAVSSLINYGFAASNIAYNTYKFNLSVNYFEIGNESIKQEEKYKWYQNIAELEGVKEYSIQRTLHGSVNKKDIKFTEEGKDYIKEFATVEEKDDIYIPIFSLGKEEYIRYINKLGLDYENCKDKIILINDFVKNMYVNDEYKKVVGSIYDFKVGDKINAEFLAGMKSGGDVKEELEIAAVTNEKPMGKEEAYYGYGTIIVSDEFMDKYNWSTSGMYIYSDNSEKVEAEIKKNFKDAEVFNIDREVKSQNTLIIIVSIFLYGFIIVITLIGITNIFNTITSNMNLRSKEFANLKSIGMTKKEFNRMIRLESILYGTKALLIGVPIGILGSYLLYKAFNIGITLKYAFPLTAILTSVVAVFILIGVIMKYSLNKINKQNIIETIRRENI